MGGLQAWEIFADAVISRAARRRRELWGSDVTVAGVAAVLDSDIGRLLADLPLARSTAAPARTGTAATADDADRAVDRAVTLARDALHRRDSGPFSSLVSAAELDEVSVEVFAVLAAIGWDPTRLRLIGYIQDDAAPRGAMVAALPSLLGRDAEVLSALAPDSALRRACLIDISTDGPPGVQIVTVPTSLHWFLIGDQSSDPHLPLDTTAHSGPPLTDAPRLTLVNGLDRIRRLQAASRVVGTSRLISCPEPTTDEQWAALVRTALCQQAVVALEVEVISGAVRRWVERTTTVPWVISTRFPVTLEDLPAVPFVESEVDDGPLTDAEVTVVLGEVPVGHRLSPNQLYLLSRHKSIESKDAIRRLASGELDKLAKRIRPRRRWDDLVLAPDRLEQVREVIVRVRQRSQVFEHWGFRPVPSAGVLALFAGASGTGKTMSAEIIAGELGLDMFKIDLSALVSKYIGETEKNLERVFTAAEGGGVVLVFDEADAVFGKRTKVSDAQDRYANIETSYLLQRLESYDGLVVLTSNLSGNIDPAFLRRIHISVEFPLPDEDERLAIWKTSFPDTAPLGEIDFDSLAQRFKFAGGSIRTAALTAAFAAADAGSSLSMAHVMHGIRREYQKLGRIITPAEFGEWM